jgi:hypothetical protein
MYVVFAYYTFQNFHILTITGLNKQIATSDLNIPF